MSQSDGEEGVHAYPDATVAFPIVILAAAVLASLSFVALLIWFETRPNPGAFFWAAAFAVGAAAFGRICYRALIRSRFVTVYDDGIRVCSQNGDVLTFIRWGEVKKVEQRRSGRALIVKLSGIGDARIAFDSSIDRFQTLIAMLNRQARAVSAPITFVSGRFGTARSVSELAGTP